ncbi:hypothetical protein MBLNU459_g8298t1 [Dothideomycetes sp. NU459]
MQVLVPVLLGRLPLPCDVRLLSVQSGECRAECQTGGLHFADDCLYAAQDLERRLIDKALNIGPLTDFDRLPLARTLIMLIPESTAEKRAGIAISESQGALCVWAQSPIPSRTEMASRMLDSAAAMPL